MLFLFKTFGINLFFLWVLKGAEIPAPESASLEAGLLFSDAVDFSEDGTSQQDINPRVQDLIAGGHSDTCHHEMFVSLFVTKCGAGVGPYSWYQSKDLKKKKEEKKKKNL